MNELDQPLKGFKILVCVSASISAYKSVVLVRYLVKLGAFVSVALTPSATRFVGAATFSALASEPAYDDLWDNRGAISHTTLGKASDLIVVCPATASTIAKMANGYADDIVSSALLCTPKETPVIVVPAMHEEMFEHVATQENIDRLKSRSIDFVGPELGELAGGDIGKGRLAETAKIVDRVLIKLENVTPKDTLSANGDKTETVSFKRPVLLVTAGGTREPIDTVRVIANRSTGKMGHALSKAGIASGYKVILITTSDLPSGEDVERIQVETSDEMYNEVLANLERADVVIMAAAVADFKAKEISLTKLKRKEALESIDLVPTNDILEAVVSKKNSDTFVVGFAAESENLLTNAKSKFESKRLDLLVANDISRTESQFGSDTNKVWVFDHSKSSPLELDVLPKEALAFEILEIIETNRAATN
ncbi:MAG TPA: bifunctional phosphopantothenoylcysteine decarboxylase/phosphopantothenate--cysteine ligase CoaBC [Acidimicrobiia bacterium]|nr:bifunctional phosphopantothenoylcysteine decarboxylase/phosphopantothenate--cysteine ligase CoaBC [Acidimicrobiia bacterium]